MDKSAIVLAACALISTGCATTSNSLNEVDGHGALAIPISIELVRTTSHSCGSLGFDLNGETKRVYFNNLEELVEDNFSGYMIINDLEPGEYLIDKYLCFAKQGRVFNRSQKFLSYPTYYNFNITSNQVTISPFQVSGYTRRNHDGGTRFRIEVSEHHSLMREYAADDIESDYITDGWSIQPIPE